MEPNVLDLQQIGCESRTGTGDVRRRPAQKTSTEWYEMSIKVSVGVARLQGTKVLSNFPSGPGKATALIFYFLLDARTFVKENNSRCKRRCN